MSRRLAALAFAALVAAPASHVTASTAHGAVNVSRFSVAPSTTRAGAHPTLDFAVGFDPATADVKDIRVHLPAGLGADSRAAPFCPRGRLVSDLCPLRTKVGTVKLVGVALGFEAEVRRNIYNVRPSPGEHLRLGVPVFGTASRGGAALMLPVTRRPDGGLDIAVAGPPQEVAGYQVGIKEVAFRIQGTVRRRVKRRVVKRALLTNPRSCAQASTILEITAHTGPPPSLTRVSSFTPTGCGR